MNLGNENGTPTPVPQSQSDRSGPVDVTRLRVPITLTLGIIGMLVTGVGSVAMTWWRTAAHASQKMVHIDEEAAVLGGGVAYKADVGAVRADVHDLRGYVDSTTQAAHRKTRKLVRSSLNALTCHRTAAGFSCRVDLPEDE